VPKGRPKKEAVEVSPHDPGQQCVRGRYYKTKKGKVGKLVSVNRELLEHVNPRFHYEYGLRFTDAHDEIISWWLASELTEVAAPKRKVAA
jgi:hypothetical protein